MEYWSLEQAKLSQATELPLARQVVLITGAASGIGAATAVAFAAAGAHMVLLDRNSGGMTAVADAARTKGAGVLEIETDVTDAAAVAEAFAAAARQFGGVDIAVSNAGAVWQGDMADCDDADLRASFELNFFAHQHVAREAVRLFRRQGTGGQLLFNASKSAFNPGPGLGPYTLPKAAVIALMRQYALDYGAIGVRSNAINADRVSTDLFGAGVLEERAKARGLTVEAYLSGNLLGRSVTVDDVARAFVALALSAKTTATVLPVDGGNIAAAPR
jgi:NAD(P)-dependent dehydrogenase (short-subunit alcohol dehydrogenase family)